MMNQLITIIIIVVVGLLFADYDGSTSSTPRSIDPEALGSIIMFVLILSIVVVLIMSLISRKKQKDLSSDKTDSQTIKSHAKNSANKTDTTKTPELDDKDKILFQKFFKEVEPHCLNYIKTFLPKHIMPTELSLNIEDNQICAFMYILENNYQIKIPDIKVINYDTLYLSENTLIILRNILNKYSLSYDEEKKKCIVDFVLNYIYALEVYKIFENKFLNNDQTVERNIDNLINRYIMLFKDNLLYVDLLLEYINKHNIELPEITEEAEDYLFDNNEMLFDNYVKDEIIPYHIYTFDFDFDDYFIKNKKYFYLLYLIQNEIKQIKIKEDAQNLIKNMTDSENNTPTELNFQNYTNTDFPKTNPEWWMSLTPWDFEKEIAELFKMQGYNVKITKGSGDGGVDMFLTKDSCNIIVQCKQYNNPVPPEPIRALWGIKDDYGADKVILIATNGITKGGKEFIQNKEEFIVYTLDDIINLENSNHK